MKNLKQKMEKCKRFEICSSPICPMDSEKENYIWYPDEEICAKQDFGKLQYIITQKKIKKVEANPEKYFTFEMLNRDYIVKKGIEGLDPDKVSPNREEKEVSEWLNQHPEISKETREKWRQQMIQKKETVTNSQM